MSRMPSVSLAPSIPLAGAKHGPSAVKRRLIKYGIRLAIAAVVFTVLVGVLHLPFAAGLLRMISPADVCPVLRGSPAQVDRAHAIGAAAIAASAVAAAPARPALGFELDVTRKADLDAWASRHGISCSNIAGLSTLQRCPDVPAAAVGQADDLGKFEEITFQFLSTGQLVNVQTTRRGLTAEQAAHTAGVLAQTAAAALGAPTTSAGEPAAAYLSRGMLTTFIVEHTFTDYRATVTATNLGETGMMVREQYLSARVNPTEASARK